MPRNIFYRQHDAGRGPREIHSPRRPWRGILHYAYPVLLVGMAMLLASCTGGSSLEKQVYFVSSGAVPGGDGMSWETAFTHPQDAIDIAASGDQIWVAKGEYGLRDVEDRNIAILKSGVLVLGGFEGTESDAGMRDPEAAVTVLNGQGHAYHVVLAVGTEGAVIDGFTITGGRAVGTGLENAEFHGGGIYSAYSSLEIRRCRFIENDACQKGGAIYSEDGDTTITESTFERNSATFGGAVNNYLGTATVINSIFTDNSAAASGGAVSDFDSSSATFVNTVFSGNSSRWTGGAVLSNSSGVVFTNCTFNGNRCQEKPGGAISLYEGCALLINCILWGDLAPVPSEVWSVNGQIEMRYSTIMGGNEGTGNLDVKPDFVRFGTWDETDNWIEGDYRLLDGSSGIDSGTSEGAPNFDLVGILRPQELAYDHGAYEHSEEH